MKLISGTVHVDPLNDYVAVEAGEHRFFQLLPGNPKKRAEVPLFTHVWKQGAGSWKLAGMLSYGRRLTQ